MPEETKPPADNPPRVEQVAALRKQGLSYGKIAKLLGISKSAVQQYIERKRFRTRA